MASTITSMINLQKDDDLKASLRNYEIQLQQVEAALSSMKQEEGLRSRSEEEQSSYDELLKLKSDLETVIKLTKDLMREEELLGGIGDSTNYKNDDTFKSGDLVLAPWSEDGMYYKAIVEDVTSDGQCNVCFFKNEIKSKPMPFNEVCLLSLLKPLHSGSSGGLTKNKGNKNLNDDTSDKRKLKLPKKDMDSTHPASETKAKRFLLQQQREEMKKRQLKRQQRKKELEEEREKDKNKWQQFHSKIMNKKHLHVAGLKKKQSIFASPSTIEGKVGVGTCGIGGKPMTDYVVAEKYKRGSATLAAAIASATGSSLPSSSASSSSSKHVSKYKQ